MKVYTIQNYGNGTSFGHIHLKIDIEHKKFMGINYVTNNEEMSYNESKIPWLVYILNKISESHMNFDIHARQ